MQDSHYPLSAIKTLHDGVTLTDDYNDNTGSSYHNKAVGITNEAILYVTYETGAGETDNILHLAIEASPTADTNNDGDDWHLLTASSVSGGTITVAEAEYQFTGAAAATTYKFEIPFDLNDKYIRVSVKETGVASNAGTATVKLALTGQ